MKLVRWIVALVVLSIWAALIGTALYVAMPRPFVFNVPGAGRDRLVQIKVQLMVRGTDNEETAKMHIPMIEGTLLKVFSGSNADDLVTEAGKVSMRDQSLREVQKAMQDIAGGSVVEKVLFTGFVMQCPDINIMTSCGTHPPFFRKRNGYRLTRR